jgi:rod shape-determining protein MreD
VLLIGVAGILQSSLAPYLQMNTVHPNLVFSLVLTLGVSANQWSHALLWAFLGGALLDMLSGVSFGTFTISTMITVLLALIWRPRLMSNRLLPIFLIFPYSIVFNVIAVAIFASYGYTVSWLQLLSTVIIPESSLNLLVLVVLLPGLLWLNRRRSRNDLTM